MVKTKSRLAGTLIVPAVLLISLRTARGGGNLKTLVHGGTAIGNVRWADQALPVAWKLNSDGAINNTNNGNASSVGLSQVQAALEAAFETWDAPPCSQIAFAYGGLTEEG